MTVHHLIQHAQHAPALLAQAEETGRSLYRRLLGEARSAVHAHVSNGDLLSCDLGQTVEAASG